MKNITKTSDTLAPIHQVVATLNEAFGPALVVQMSGMKDPKAPFRWAKPGATMRPEPERNLRFAHRVYTSLITHCDQQVLRAWFVSSCATLGEDSPIVAIRDGRHKEVSQAAAQLTQEPDADNAEQPAEASVVRIDVSDETGFYPTSLFSNAIDSGGAPATMRDVAERSGVSIKTVSNVVNGSNKVSSHTRARVQKAISELGYQLNMTARSLRRGRTGMIGLILPELRVPYFAELADSVLKAAEAQNLTLLIEQTGSLGEHEVEVLSSPRRRFTDGVLFSPVALDPRFHPELDVDYPLVLLGERIFDPRYDHVTMANVEASKKATELLAAKGCQHIALLGYHENDIMSSARLRFEGYCQGLKAAGLPFDPRLLGTAGRWVRSTGLTAMNQVLDSGVPVDGVFAMNDALALGALPALRKRGLRVPEDVAVIGFDDIDDARYSDPPLSSVDPGRDEIAARAVDLLVSKIAGRAREPEHIVAQFSVVERESSKRI
ncbi:LacI family DNA-binding transcriptional regulator [Populibacterium corticicola]|uniref:LacI family DNA-binding transcriptional regulator n=1 Tax=Populibacterium corticicola TaxID=1812826 RepID=A0ABW5XDW3_9MICO